MTEVEPARYSLDVWGDLCVFVSDLLQGTYPVGDMELYVGNYVYTFTLKKRRPRWS